MFRLSLFRALHRGESPVVGETPSPNPLYRPPVSSRLEVRSLPALGPNGVSLPQHDAQVAWDLRSSLPSTCRWLGPEDVNLVSEHPVASGEFANIHEATHDGRKVMLKSYRCYVSKFDIAQVVAVRCSHTLH